MNLSLSRVALGLTLGLLVTSASAGTVEWNVNASGNWTLGTNWSTGTAPVSGDIAVFGPVPTVGRTVTVDAAAAAAELRFNTNPRLNGNYVLAGTAGLTLDAGGQIWLQNLAGNSGPNITTPLVFAGGDPTIRVDSYGNLSLNGALSGTIGTLQKTGAAMVTLGANNTFVGNISITDGILAIGNHDLRLGDVNNDVAINGGIFQVNNFAWNPGATRSFTLGANGAGFNITGNTSTFDEAGQLSGDGPLRKLHSGTMAVTQANVGLTGPVKVMGGVLDTSAATTVDALGSGAITVGRAAQYNLPNASTADRVYTVASGAMLQGNAIALGNLTNHRFERGAILLETAPGANASIPGLTGGSGDYFFGLRGVVNEPSGLSLGNGTPWAGLASGRAATGNLTVGTGTAGSNEINVSGEVVFQHNGQNLIIGTTTLTSNAISATSSISLTGGADLVIDTNRGGGTVQIAGSNNNFGGVYDLTVRPGAHLDLKGSAALGLSGAPDIVVERGGTLWASAESNTLGGGAFADPAYVGNALSDSAVTLRGASLLNLRNNSFASTTGDGVSQGGDIYVEADLPVTINAGRIASVSNNIVKVANLDLTGASRGLILQNGNGFGWGVTGNLTSGPAPLVLGAQGTGNFSVANWVGEGTVIKGDTGTLTLFGDQADMTGDVVVKSGGLVLQSDASLIFGAGAEVPGHFRIDLNDDLASSARGYAFLTLNSDTDLSSRIDGESRGALLLGANNSVLTSVGGSAAILGASGAARTLSSTTFDSPGDGIYRFGAGGQTLILDTAEQPGGVLLEGNHLQIGGVRNNLVGGTWANGSGTVILNDTNSLDGQVTINNGSTLTLNATNALGDGTTLDGAVVHGTLSIGGTGGSGSIGGMPYLAVRPGGTLVLDNTGADVADRLPDSVPLELQNGTLTLAGRNSAGAVNTESLGAVDLLPGTSVINVNRTNASATTTLTLASLNRHPGATVNIATSAGSLGGGENNPNLAITDQAAGFVGGWAVVNNSGFAEYSGTSVQMMSTSGRPTLDTADATGHAYNTANANLTGSKEVASLHVSGASAIDLGSGTLTLGSGGLLHTGGTAVAIGNGTLASSNGELIITSTNSSTTVNAGLTGMLDLTKAGSGTLVFAGSAKDFSGNLHIDNGYLELQQPLTGNLDIFLNGQVGSNATALRLKADANSDILTNAAIHVFSPEALTSGNQGTIINVDRLSSGSGMELRVGSLEVADNSRLNITGGNSARLVVTGDLSLGQNAILHTENSNSPVVVRGTYHDTPSTTLRNNQNQFSNYYSHGLVFDGQQSYTVHGNFYDANNQRAHLSAVGAGTEVTYQGYLAGGSATTHISAWDGGRVIFGEHARIDNSLGWSGTTYAQINQIAFNTSGGGVIEFAEGFQAAHLTGTADRTDVNFGGELRLLGSFITNHDQNLPKYQGYMRFEDRDIVWTTQTNDQHFPNQVGFTNSGVLNTVADLTLAGPVYLGGGMPYNGTAMANVQRDWSESNGLFRLYPDAYNISAEVAVTKAGNGVLDLTGPVVTSLLSTVNLTAGEVRFNGTIYATMESVLDLRTDGGTYQMNANFDVPGGHSLTVQEDGVNLAALPLGAGRQITGGGTIGNVVEVKAGSSILPVEGARMTLAGLQPYTLGSVHISADGLGDATLVRVDNLSHGPIGAWATAQSGFVADFAAYDNEAETVTLWGPASRPTTLNAAGATDFVYANVVQPALTTSKNVAGVTSVGQDFDLGGNTLNTPAWVHGSDNNQISNGTLGVNGRLTVATAMDLNIAANLAGSGVLAKVGRAHLTLSSANPAFSGEILVGDGVLDLTADGAAGTGSIQVQTGGRMDVMADLGVGSQVSLMNNGQVNFYTANPVVGSLSGSSWQASLGMLEVSQLTVGADNSNTSYVGTINGYGDLNKVGSGSLELRGKNTYHGSTRINAGTLVVHLDENLGAVPGEYDPGNLRLSGGGTLRIGSSFALHQNRGIILDGGGMGLPAIETPQAVRFTVNGGILDLGEGAVLGKAGPGTLTLNGESTAGIDVLEGQLVLNGSARTITLEANTTLSGAGMAEAINIAPGATLSPGNSPGTLSVQFGLGMGEGVNYNWQIADAAGEAGVGYDLINITEGGLDLTGLTGLNLNLWSILANSPYDVSDMVANFDPNDNYQWTIVQTADGITGFDPAAWTIHANPANGTGGFQNSLAEGGYFSLELGNEGMNLVLSYVPEPSTYPVLGGLLALLVAAWRRRR